MTELKLTVRFPKDYQMNTFVNMLAWMELCGNVGHSTDFVVFLDGDGNARPKFIFENDDLQKSFDELRRDYGKYELSSIPNVRGINIKNLDMVFKID